MMVSQLFIFNDIIGSRERGGYFGEGDMLLGRCGILLISSNRTVLLFEWKTPVEKIGGIETSRMTRDILYIIGES